MHCAEECHDSNGMEGAGMLQFLFRGLIRDRHRSLFPVIIVALGVFLTTFLYSWLNGVFSDIIEVSARFDTGHIKLMTRSYDELADQFPNDLAIAGTDNLIQDLSARYPEYRWVPRIHLGGLLDIPDKNGETRTQGPVMGLGLELMDSSFGENERLNIQSSLVRGHFPEKPGEILIAEQLSQDLDVNPGDVATLVGATAGGAMAIQNFIVAGTVKFGMMAMDRSSIIVDIEDARYALDMNDMSSEILGYDRNMLYDPLAIEKLAADIDEHYSDESDPYSLIARPLADQNGLGAYLNYAEMAGVVIVVIFLAVMAVVLWNTSLMGGIRRYGEVGVRLAIGETKWHVYFSMIWESVFIGLAGSILGTAIGLLLALYLQEVGIDFSKFAQGSSMMMNNIVRARITPGSYYLGFLPGLVATVLGTMFAGVAIFKRQTASLFKELEV